MSTSIIRVSGKLACIVLAALTAIVPARAEDAPYAGTWALEVGSCGAGQESQDAPLVIAKDRYDQHETHCTFKSVEEKDGDFKISADCTVEGSAQAHNLTLTVSGDTLTFGDEAGARDYLRCK
jgi:hypothetical protein